MRAILCTLIATAIAMLPVSGQAQETGLNLENPGLIDAAARVMFPWVEQKDFRRVGPRKYEIYQIGKPMFELIQSPTNDCVFQTANYGDRGKPGNQANFDRLSAEYTTYSDMRGLKIRFHGSKAWCIRTGHDVSCYNSYDVPVSGAYDVRRVIRAMEFIQSNGCPALQPKDPF